MLRTKKLKRLCNVHHSLSFRNAEAEKEEAEAAAINLKHENVRDQLLPEPPFLRKEEEEEKVSHFFSLSLTSLLPRPPPFFAPHLFFLLLLMRARNNRIQTEWNGEENVLK